MYICIKSMPMQCIEWLKDKKLVWKPRNQNVFGLPCPCFHPWLQSTTRCYDWCPHRRLQTRRPASYYICFFLQNLRDQLARTWDTSHLLQSLTLHLHFLYMSYLSIFAPSWVKDKESILPLEQKLTTNGTVLAASRHLWSLKLKLIITLIHEMFFSFGRRS